MINDMVIVRGGGDIATGVIQKLFRSGFKVLVLEVEKPTAIRRKVSLCEAVFDQKVVVEDIEAVLVKDIEAIEKAWNDGFVPVMVDETGESIRRFKPKIVVDAILAKKNLGTNRSMAPITVAIGPGFNASVDVDVVIETKRGHQLGKLIFNGCAIKNSGIPGVVGGYSIERVIHSPKTGVIHNLKNIGDVLKAGDVIALIDKIEVKTNLSGILRGIIRDNLYVTKGLKIADVDPRFSEIENCHTISDKARSIGGAVLEAILYKKNKLRLSGDYDG